MLWNSSSCLFSQKRWERKIGGYLHLPLRYIFTLRRKSPINDRDTTVVCWLVHVQKYPEPLSVCSYKGFSGIREGSSKPMPSSKRMQWSKFAFGKVTGKQHGRCLFSKAAGTCDAMSFTWCHYPGARGTFEASIGCGADGMSNFFSDRLGLQAITSTFWKWIPLNNSVISGPWLGSRFFLLPSPFPFFSLSFSVRGTVYLDVIKLEEDHRWHW